MDAAPTPPVPGHFTVTPENPRSETATALLATMRAELTRRYHLPSSLYLVEEARHPRAGFLVP